MRNSVAVFGGYGVFGARVARELARRGKARGVEVRVVGRDGERAKAFAGELGEQHSGVAGDLARIETCREAMGDSQVIVNCAGPFASFEPSLVELSLAEDKHYVDIAEGREHARGIAKYHRRFASAGLVAAFGCSSLPTVSMSLAQAAIAGGETLGDPLAAPLRSLRATLFIGHDNPKGAGAVGGAAAQIGKPIETPLGERLGFGNGEIVELPPPLGRRRVFDFNSPEYDLAPSACRLAAEGDVRVKVGFEQFAVNKVFGLAARYAPVFGRRWLPRLAAATDWTRKLGTSVGAVMCEATDSNGKKRSLAALAQTDGQRLAALPAVYVALNLLAPRVADSVAGVFPGYVFLGAAELLEKLAADGVQIVASNGGENGSWKQVFPSKVAR